MVHWIWIPVSILIVMLVFLTPIALELYKFGLGRQTKRDINPPDADPVAWAASHAQGDWSLQSHDGIRLMAYHFPAPMPSSRWAVLVHGYAASATMAFPWARRFHEQGFHVLAVDCRAHGRSEGDSIGMGWPDRRDVAAWTRRISAFQPEARIVLYGVSMGGATVMMASGDPGLSPGVSCLVEDCGYTTVYAEFAYRMRRMFHLPAFPLLPMAGGICLIRNGYSFFGASSVRQLRRNRLPILFIHGEEDTFVPFAMVHKLYSAAPGEKDLYTVPGAGHGLSSAVDPQYWPTVFAFIGKHMPETA